MDISMQEIYRAIQDLEQRLTLISNQVNAMKIDDQTHIRSNKPIPSGIGTKIAYDSKGLVTSSSLLHQSDIPDLTIDKITGLSNALSDKCTKSDLESVKKEFESSFIKDPSIYATGIKINYNKDGRVLSSSDLSVNDIPTLPIDKIDGLSDMLNQFKVNLKPTQSPVIQDTPSVRPGTYSKITVNKSGDITDVSNLTMNDLPGELLTRLNTIESQIPSLVSHQSFNALNVLTSRKIDANAPVTPGEYTKVSVDEKGLVTKGGSLSMNDLPSDLISLIDQFSDSIINKADRNDLLNLHNDVSQLVSAYTTLSSRINKNDVSSEIKDIKGDIADLSRTIDSLIEIMNNYMESLPVDSTGGLLNDITTRLDTAIGRIDALENRLS